MLKKDFYWAKGCLSTFKTNTSEAPIVRLESSTGPDFEIQFDLNDTGDNVGSFFIMIDEKIRLDENQILTGSVTVGDSTDSANN